MSERLDKLLVQAGIGSRSEVKGYIRAGRIRVGGAIVKECEYKADSGAEISFDGRLLNTAKFRYFMLNKPAGVVSATEDRNDKTVTELFAKEKVKELFPVGRLDKDTEGLLIMTNDGETAHKLLSPKKHVDKTYYARVSGCLEKSDIVVFEAGIEFRDFKSLPAKLKILSVDRENNISEAEVTICEGKYHQVKRMFAHTGKEVTYLKRLSMGSLMLDKSLKPGEYRELTADEIERIVSGG